VYTLSSFSITRPSFWTEGWRVCKRGFSRARHSCLIDTMDCWKKSLRKKISFRLIILVVVLSWTALLGAAERTGVDAKPTQASCARPREHRLPICEVKSVVAFTSVCTSIALLASDQATDGHGSRAERTAEKASWSSGAGPWKKKAEQRVGGEG